MAGSLTRLITRNWPIKLAAVFLALMLYVAVAAQQPISQSFDLKVTVLVPPGRALLSRPPTPPAPTPSWPGTPSSQVATPPAK
ncbi:MAG: hypothetical protein AUH42_06255 [Gemmatimonadetes bacterium 13_1_40CM_70_11]|nr:MAG: hypothetical protein AUH42_06255 [Gemmatimonadetes bacterium 13_1_40CM_70_11]